jgi:hypothetical protein
MIGGRRMGGHLGIAALGLAGTLAFVGFGADHSLADRVSMWGAVGVCTLMIVGHSLLLLWNPNRNLISNRNRCKKLVLSNTMQVLREETPDRAAGHLPRWGFGPAHGLALVGMAFANLLFVAAELVRAACGWPMNPEWIPGVIGPGDESRLYFAERFYSVKGYWSGEPSATALNARELGLGEAALPADTKRDSWPRTIYVDNGEGSKAETPWVEVRIPDSPALGGKQLQVRADLTAVFPVLHGDHYEEEQRDFARTTTVRLAARPGAGRLYAHVWHGGGFAGAAWFGLMSLVLVAAAWSLRRHAFPLKVVHNAEDEPDDEDEDRYDRPRRKRERDD